MQYNYRVSEKAGRRRPWISARKKRNWETRLSVENGKPSRMWKRKSRDTENMPTRRFKKRRIKATECTWTAKIVAHRTWKSSTAGQSIWIEKRPMFSSTRWCDLEVTGIRSTGPGRFFPYRGVRRGDRERCGRNAFTSFKWIMRNYSNIVLYFLLLQEVAVNLRNIW